MLSSLAASTFFAAALKPTEGGGIALAVIAVLGLLVLAWATFRTQGLQAWRNAAEGYKEQVGELTLRLESSEKKAEELHETVSTLERRPDMTAVVEALENRSEQNAATVVKAVREMLDPIEAGLGELRSTLAGRSGS